MTAHAAHIAVRGRAPRRSSPPAPALPARSQARAADERAGCAEAARLGALPRHFFAEKWPKTAKSAQNGCEICAYKLFVIIFEKLCKRNSKQLDRNFIK